MSMNLAFERPETEFRAVSPMCELGAYEALWDQPDVSFRKIAQLFRASPGAVPSDFVPAETCAEYAQIAVSAIRDAGIKNFGVRVHGAGDYPEHLRDAMDPVELLYFRGWWDLAATPSVAVVGTRKPTKDGISRARRLAKCLVEDGYTVVSGLAAGIDTNAHRAAIDAGGWTIAVIGTPITHCYPKENKELQQHIAEKYLLVSQIPVCRYLRQGPRVNRFFFPERNKTMSALTQATVIVEAGNTSGTLVQARAALQQQRKLFILDSCFQNSALTWPRKYEERGAIRVRDYDDIRKHLRASPSIKNR